MRYRSTICQKVFASALLTALFLVPASAVAPAGPQHYDDPALQAFIGSVVPPAKYEARLEPSHMVSMRDGIMLSTDLYFPGDRRGPLPVILIRTPYNKGTPQQRATAQFFADHGFVVAVQDLRGKYESEGQFFPYSKQERTDGYDTVAWLAKQPWSNGKVGTFGCSYVGEVQYLLAAERPPALAAAIPQSGCAYAGRGVTDFGFMRHGVLELAAAFSWNRTYASTMTYGPPPGVDRGAWFASPQSQLYRTNAQLPAIDLLHTLDTLPLSKMMSSVPSPPNEFDNWIKEPPTSSYWARQGGITDADHFDVPALHINSWYDVTPTSTLKLFELMRTHALSRRAAENQFLIMAPSTHCNFDQATEHTMVGDRDVGDARLNFAALYLAWFDHWLSGVDNGIERMPKVLLYVMGRDKWTAASGWPLAGTVVTPYYLGQDGALSPDPPGRGRADSYIYDPLHPTPSLGGTCCTGKEKSLDGSLDQRLIEGRSDVLVYSTPPLQQGVEVTGDVTADLFVTSSARDTDFVVKLVDVYPDGRAFSVLEGIARARYRDGLDAPHFMRAGKIYRISVDLEATSNYFAPGHRISVLVTSSSHPRFARNLNTGGDNWSEARAVIAHNAILHDQDHPSAINLSIVPRP